MKSKMLAVIPARGGSKRIPNKNIRPLNGKPLIYYTIKVAKESKIFDRIVVDTDSPEIAKVARRFGAEVPFLRPEHLAGDKAKVADAIEFLINRLKKEENYSPDLVCLLQTTSPLRNVEDITKCWEVMKNPKTKSVCTITETSPWFFNLGKGDSLLLVNKKSSSSTNTQEVAKGFMLNGCIVYIVRTRLFMKNKKFVDFGSGATVGVVCPHWRSVDLDYPEDWVLAEFLHANKEKIEKKLKSFK